MGMINDKNDPYLAIRYKEFRLYLIARFFLTFALSLPVLLLGWWLFEKTKDPRILGNVCLAEIIPALVLSLFAGRIIDKSEKRNLILKAYLANIFVAAGMLIATSDFFSEWTHNQLYISIWAIYFLSFIGGIIRSFLEPAAFSFSADLTPKEVYINASIWSSSSWIAAAVLGPTIGGFLYGILGITGSFMLMMVLILLASVFIFQIEKKPIAYIQEGETFWQSLTTGLNFVFNTKIILAALSLDLFAVLFGGAMALLPVFAMDILKVGTEGLGLLRAATFLGTFLTLFVLAYYPIKNRPGVKLMFAVFAYGIAMIGFGMSTYFWLSFFFLFLSGIVDGISINLRRTILQLKTPHNMRGRVAAVNTMFVGSSNELGGYESGVTAGWWGPTKAVVIGGYLTLLVVGIVAWRVPQLRNMKLEE